MRSGVIPTRRWRRRRCVTADTRNLWGRIVFQKPANGRQSVEGRPRAAVRVPARVWLDHEPQVVEGDDETPCDAAISHTTRGARAHRRLPSHRWRTGDVPHSRYAVREVGVLMGAPFLGDDWSCEHGGRWIRWPGLDGKGAWMQVVAPMEVVEGAGVVRAGVVRPVCSCEPPGNEPKHAIDPALAFDEVLERQREDDDLPDDFDEPMEEEF